MIQKVTAFIRAHCLALVLAVVAVYLSWANYTPGTWLSGWDTLHPEFDFPLNFQRILSAWHEEQGLGTLTGHSQVAELPRMIFLWLTSLVLPVSFLRYFYFFICLILGPLGVYFFLEKIAFVGKENTKSKILSFLGGLFYLLNLGAVQHFFVPFEMFATLYAFLPWILLFTDRFIKIGLKKDLILFSFLSFLSASMAYAATLWYAFFAFFSFYVLTTLLKDRNRINFKRVLILFLTILCVNSFWLLPNLYYLSSSAKNVPQAKINIIFSERAFSTDEKYATPDNALLLKGFLFDWQKYNKGEFVPLLTEWKNHLDKPVVGAVGWVISITILTGIFTSLFSKKGKLGVILLPGFVFSFIFLIYGTPVLKDIFSVLREKIDIFKEGLRFPWTKFSIFVIFSFAVYFSLGIGKIASLWRKNETKVLAIFCLPFFTALVIVWTLPAFKGNLISPLMRIRIPQDYFDLFSFFKNKPKSERIALFPASSFLGWEYYRWGFEGAGFIWFGLPQPVLTRDFDRWHPANENFYWEISYAIYSKNEELFKDVLQKYQVKWLLFDESKIDPAWPTATSSTTEFQELISKSEDISLEQTFGKIKIYKVNLETPVKDFIYLTENLPVVNGYEWGNEDKAYSEIGNYISDSSVERKAQSEEPKLKAQNFNDPQKVGNRSPITNHQSPITPGVYYPFRSLFTGRKTEELSASWRIEIEDLGDRFVFRKKLPKEVEKYELAVPSYDGNELLEVDKNDLTKVNYFIPTAEVRNGKIEVVIPKVKGLFSTEIESAEEKIEVKNCNQFSGGEVRNESVKWEAGSGKLEQEVRSENKEVLRLEAEDANNCSAAFWLPELPHKYGYLISVESENIAGKPLLFWVENLTNRKADQELYLDFARPPLAARGGLARLFLIQPPMAEDGLGYSLHFDNISIGREQTINDLGKISVHPIPYEFLLGIKLVNPVSDLNDIYHLSGVAGGVKVYPELIEGLSDPKGVNVNHPNPGVYEIKYSSSEIEKNPSNLSTEGSFSTGSNDIILVLSQAYHEGWKAYIPSAKFKVQSSKLLEYFPFLFGKEIGEHVKVNNWENGWNLSSKLEGERTIVLVFWPQYLEYTGFVLMAISFVGILFIKKTNLF